MRLFFRFLSIFVICCSVKTSYADVQGASNFVDKIAQQVISIVKDDKLNKNMKTDQIFKLLNDNFDLKWMSKFVIGKNYRQLSDQQKSEYQDIYGKFFLYSYLPNLMKYTNESFKIDRSNTSEDGLYTIYTAIIRDNGQEPILINYQIKEKDGQYKVIDVIVEGVSAIMSQRSEFDSIIAQSGLDKFLVNLKAKQEQLASNKNNS